MYIESVPNRNSAPAVLLRESYRDHGKVHKRTLANLSHWPVELVEGLRILLRGGTAVSSAEEAFSILRTRPHGHVAAVLGALRRCGLESLIASKRSRLRDLAVALIAARILRPCSKLATSRGLGADTRVDTLGEELGVEDADEDELYAAMDWLVERQDAIERRLADKHLAEGSLVLYDLTSTYFEGRSCPLARHGYSRDGKRGKLQVVFGLLCDREGCPVAVEVFEGNTADPNTVSRQVEKLRQRFELSRVVLVADRGMLTTARIRQDLQPAGLDWISALRSSDIQDLVQRQVLQPSLFDERDLAEIRCEEKFPAERLVVCRNPLLAQERSRKREDLLQATETALEKVRAATLREKRPLKGERAIAVRVARVVGKYRMAKHFLCDITDHSFSYSRNQVRIEREKALDGFYVIRTSVPAHTLGAEQAVGVYKSLSQVERAFRSYKTVDLKVRPIYHHLATRVRAHVFLCMLAYHVEFHMRKKLAPMLFDDHLRPTPPRPSPVAPATPSPQARRKATTKRSADDLPVHSFQTLLQDLATIAKNQVLPSSNPLPFDIVTRPTPLQQQALSLLRVTL